MKKKIAILGSTGSIGKTLLKIIGKNKKKFQIELLSANKNIKTLLNQAKEFNVRNLIITDKNSYLKLKSMQIRNINIYNNFNNLDIIFKKKIDYAMSSIIGLEGLKPTFNIIRFTKKIAIANKESLICAWNLISKELKKFNTEFIPVDSEHFSVWFSLDKNLSQKIEKIYLTASGGPFLKKPLSGFNNISIKESLKHPNWKMGKKISIDSSTLMNKIYEVIEARNIFNISLSSINILIHPKSYIHSLIKFNNGIIKIIAHETDMKIPIFNTLYNDQKNKIVSNSIDINKLNNPKFQTVDYKRFPSMKILKNIGDHLTLYETVIVAINDTLVENFLKGKIKYQDIIIRLLALMKNKEFLKYKRIIPNSINEIIDLNNYVRLRINSKNI